ncbi:F-box/WD repeat-containing protein pof10 [Schizosaccharomyces pombe]
MKSEPTSLDFTSSNLRRMNRDHSSNNTNRTVLNLPKEILIIIFSFLDPRSLLSAQCTCKYWKKLLSDDLSWRTAFFHHFAGDQSQIFSPLGNGTWRQEYLLRSTITRAYEKGKGQTVQYDCRVGQLTNLYYDFSSGRLYSGNWLTGTISVSDPTTGKVERSLLHASTDGSFTHGLSTMTLGKQIFGFGFMDGRVGVILMSRQAETPRKFRYCLDSHADSVTCIDALTGDLPPTGEIGMVTGSDDGSVHCWDVKTGVSLQSFQFRSSQILSLCFRPKYKMLLVDTFNYELNSYQLYLIPGYARSRKNEQPILLSSRKCVLTDEEEPPCLMTADCCAGIAFLSRGAPKNCICRVSFKEFLEKNDNVGVQTSSIPLNGKPTSISLDTNDRVLSKSTPGRGARLLAVGDENGLVYVVNTRTEDPNKAILRTITAYSNFPITDIYLNEVAMVVGSASGYCGVYDTVTGNFLKKIASARNAARREPINCILLDSNPLSLKGVITMSKHVKSWSYTIPKPFVNKRSKVLPLRPSVTHDNLSKSSDYSKNEVEREIMLGLDQIAQERREKMEARQKFEQHFGEGLVGLSEEEIIAYVTMLSQEEEAKRMVQLSMDVDKIEEDFKENDEQATSSLNALSSNHEPPQEQANVAELNEQEQIELAMRLSLMEM